MKDTIILRIYIIGAEWPNSELFKANLSEISEQGKVMTGYEINPVPVAKYQHLIFPTSLRCRLKTVKLEAIRQRIPVRKQAGHDMSKH
jgi:hypothetical protein